MLSSHHNSSCLPTINSTVNKTTMWSSATASSPYSFFLRPTTTTAPTPSLLRLPNLHFFSSQYSFLRSANPGLLRRSASLADRHLELSWLPPGPPPTHDDYKGWGFVEPPPRINHEKRGLNPIVIGGIGTCVATLLAAIAYFFLSRKGFIKFQFGRALHGIRTPIETISHVTQTETETEVLEKNATATTESIPGTPAQTLPSVTTKLEHVKVPVAVDSTQLESLSVLQKLKIIEDDVKADELCTRRDYARWLISLNSLLERHPKHRIVPSISLSGSVISAFDDVGVEDPDFESIQALAEAGIIPSKLSGVYSCSGSSEGGGALCFYPKRLISRFDLINWKAQLEYGFLPGITEQMSRTRVSYLDVKEIGSDASPEFFFDMLSGDDSIIRKVFGNIRRFQPNKPLTKAQAAVALTSGRMSEAVLNEILRLEAESSSRQAAISEIRSELLERGDIQKFWDEKINDERTRSFEMENLHISTLNDLEEEKILQVKTFADHLKEKAAMDCQRQLLVCLKEEVDEMSERLAAERVTYAAEQCSLQDLLSELQTKREGMLDRKSILEAETEALRILRSWVEAEARKNQARAKVLEEVGRRWKWDNRD